MDLNRGDHHPFRSRTSRHNGHPSNHLTLEPLTPPLPVISQFEVDLEEQFEVHRISRVSFSNFLQEEEDQDLHKRSARMWCGCGRFLLLLLFIKVILLGVVLPVHLQHNDGGYDDLLNGFPNPGDEFAESLNPTTPTTGNTGSEEDNGVEVPNNDDGISSAPPGGENGAPPPSQGSQGYDIVIVQQGGELMTPGGPDPTTVMSPPEEDSKINNENAPPSSSSSSSSLTSCEGPNSPTILLEKLEDVMNVINGIHKTIENMENLMQGTVIDEQINKCISSIISGNQTLSLRHWNQIVKYHPGNRDKQLSILEKVIREAYNGKVENIQEVLEFIRETKVCEGFSTVFKEMGNYGHIYGGNPYVFTLSQMIEKTCGSSSKEFEALPSLVKTMLKGTFTLQNKFNKGYLYYAKKCAAKHYYYCLDVYTRRVSPEEIKGLEVGDEEWRRLHWKINATCPSAETFYILNEDKYMPYRLQDLQNSPRFRMEEAGNGFEEDLAKFQLMLVDEDEIHIQVRNTDIFLEGEEIKLQDSSTEALLNSFHKTESKNGQGNDKISWIVKAN